MREEFSPTRISGQALRRVLRVHPLLGRVPHGLADLTSLLKDLGPDGDRITPVFITVDPERDTQSVLVEYLQAFDRASWG